MKFTCKKDKLKKAINKIERIVSKQITLPILSNILIKTGKGQLVLVATNLEIAIKVFVSAKIEKEGELTIPPRIMSGFLSNIKDEVVEGDLVNKELYLKSENHSVKIKTLDAKDFPIIPEAPDFYYFNLKTDEVIKAISGVNISLARKDTRQELNGIFLNFSKEYLTLVSTDSFRLTEVKVLINKKSINNDYLNFLEVNKGVIIPGGLISELQQLPTGSDLNIFLDENQIFLNTNNTQITAQLINGQYPDYKQIIPNEFDYEITVDKDELLEAIKITSLVISEANGEIEISKQRDDKFLTLRAKSADLGESTSKVKLQKNDNNQFKLYFNYRYLLEGLNSNLFNTQFIKIKFKENSPVLFRALVDKKEDQTFLYLVMPITK